MDDASLIGSFLREFLYLIIVFVGFLLFAIVRGKQSLINVILGMYFGFLLARNFPYYDLFISDDTSAKTEAVLIMLIFAAFAFGSTLLFRRLMPREFDETPFEGLGKKILFATAGTILVMLLSFHLLPVTEFLVPGTPIQNLFAPDEYFFWWLIAPLGILFLL